MPNAHQCLRRGLSVFRELEDAIHQRRLLPKLGPFIARGDLAADSGKLKPTKGSQPTHTTWWVYQDVNRAARFAIEPDEG